MLTTFVSRGTFAAALVAAAACGTDSAPEMAIQPATGFTTDAGPDAETLPNDGPPAQDDSDSQLPEVTDSGLEDPTDVSDPRPQTDAGDVGQSGDAGATSTAGTCGGETPHGCYVPQAGNPMGCPPQIHEQSAYYPPFEEWGGCSSPFYEACNYARPDGSLANCACDLGLHWLCTY